MSDVVARMRALCEGGWHKGDELWDALAAGAAEIERLREAARAATWAIEGLIGQLCAYDRLPYASEVGEPASKRLDIRAHIDELTQAHGILRGDSPEAIEAARQQMQVDLSPHRALGLRREVERLRTELADAQALARGAQYREREALATVAMLRARLDALSHREMSAVAQRDALARMYAAVGQALGIDHAGDIPEALHRALADRDEDDARAREGFGAFRAQVRRERAQGDAGDLAGLGRREGRAWTVTVDEGEGR